jgi:hypothetical protein
MLTWITFDFVEARRENLDTYCCLPLTALLRFRFSHWFSCPVYSHSFTPLSQWSGQGSALSNLPLYLSQPVCARLIHHPDDEDSKLFRNNGQHLSDYKALHHRRPPSSHSHLRSLLYSQVNVKRNMMNNSTLLIFMSLNITENFFFYCMSILLI